MAKLAPACENVNDNSLRQEVEDSPIQETAQTWVRAPSRPSLRQQFLAEPEGVWGWAIMKR